MTYSPSGTNLTSVLAPYKPSFIWDAYRGGRSIGTGVTGGRVDWSIVDADSVTPADPFSIWDDGAEQFKVVDSATYPEEALGPVGDFSDGKVSNYWFTDWSTTNLGFAVTAPTSASMLSQVSGTKADIITGGVLPDVTYVDTTEVQNSVIEKSNSISSTYDRVFQVLVKSLDGHSPDTRVEVGMNSSSGTRTTDSINTWYRELPGSRGWYAVLYRVASNAITTNYITMSFKLGTGRWYVSSPMFYNEYSTFSSIIRAPIPRDSSTRERGQYYVYNTDNEFNLPVSGWMAGSIVLPDRSVSNGHLDISGAGQYSFAGLMGWSCGTYRIRLIMSTTTDALALQMDNGGTSFAFLDFPDTWSDFAPVGFVVTWGISNGTEYAYLYVNGEKSDSVVGPADWYPQTSTPSSIYIGKDGSGTAAADVWISRIALGRQPMHRVQARLLSSRMQELARGAKR